MSFSLDTLCDEDRVTITNLKVFREICISSFYSLIFGYFIFIFYSLISVIREI